jgi:hypothetical protein
MRRLGYPFLIALVVIVCSGPPALARVTRSDAATTHAYLKATIDLRGAAMATEPDGLEAIGALAAQVNAECPGVLAGAPPYVKGEKTNESEDEISQELLSATFGVEEHAEHPAYARFEKTVQRLRWSNPKLTRLLHSLAIEQAKQSAIPSPELCADMKFWVASGYTAVSAGTKHFLHEMRVVSSITLIEPEPHEPATNFLNLNALVAYRLKPYEDHADLLLARKALPAEAKLTDPALRPLLEAAGRVFVALGRTSSPTA